MSHPGNIPRGGPHPASGGDQGIPPIDIRDEAVVGILLQGLPHAVRIYDSDCRCVMANNLGCTAADLRPFRRDAPQGFLPQQPEQRAHWPVQRALETGRPATQEYVVEQDGEQAVFLDVMALPVVGERGRPRLIIEVTRDATESRVQTAKLSRLDSLLSEMVDQLSGIVDASDTLAELPSGIDLTPRPENCPHPRSMCPFFEASERGPGEMPSSCSHEICAHCQISQLTYPEQLTGLTTSLDGLLDTLRRKHRQLLDTQSEVLHAERLAAVGELVAGIAHEINNPLGIILSRLDALELEAEVHPVSQELARDLGVIRTHTDRIARTVEGLLRYCRKPAKRRRIGFDVNRVLHESLDFMGDILTKRRVDVVRDVAAHPLPIVGDPSILQQVFVNLIINAADAMADGGRLTLCSEEMNGGKSSAVIRVEDTGAGIPAAVLGRIFDPFFTTKQSQGGTGLGLSVSRRIVEEFGGTITADSASGEGTTFTITLPLDTGPQGEGI